MRLLTTIFLVLLAVSNLAASIDPYDVLVMSDPTSNTVVIRSTIPLGKRTRMELMDSRGTRIFNTEIAAGEFFSKRFPATSLPTGKLTLHLTDERGRTSLPFSTKKGSVTYSPAEGWNTFFPAIDLRDDRTLIVSYHDSRGKTLNVELSGANGDTVFTDSVSPEGSTRKAYELSGLTAGTYTLTVNSPSIEMHRTSFELR